MKTIENIQANLLIFGCEVEHQDKKSVKLYVSNLNCEGNFYVSFSRHKGSVRLNRLDGNVVDLQRFRDAICVANELLK